VKKPKSEEHKSEISYKLAGVMPKNMINKGAYSNIQSGKYKVGNQIIYFRSKWEANYALYLEFLKKQKEIKKWEYEADTFIFEKIKFGTRSYRPDFKITNNNDRIEYHEVKGYFDSKSKTKMKRMKKYYPEISLRIIDAKTYNSLKKWAKVLNFY